MVRALRSARTATLLAGWAALLDGLSRQEPAARRARPIADVAGDADRAACTGRMVKAGCGDRRLRARRGAARSAQDGQGAALPARVLRRACTPARSSSRWSGRSRRCRTRSGGSRTARCRRSCCARCATTSARSTTAPAALMAMGLLVERLEARAGGRARASSPSASPRSPAKPQRRLVAETFAMSRVARHVQHQGRRRQDVGGGEPRLSRRARGRADAAVGPRPAGREHVPVPRQAAGEGRRAQARARQERRRRADQGHRPRAARPAAGGLLLPPHGSRARRARSARRGAWRRVLAPLADEYDYVFLDCPPSISLVSESVFEAADACSCR